MAVSPKLSPKPARHAFASTLKSFKTASGKEGKFYSLPALAKKFPHSVWQGRPVLLAARTRQAVPPGQPPARVDPHRA